MNAYQRLVSVGMNPECARESVFWYMAQGDDDGLEEYVREVERNNGKLSVCGISDAGVSASWVSNTWVSDAI